MIILGMNKGYRLFCWLFVYCFALADIVLGQEGLVKADEDLVIGKLDNGFSYYLLSRKATSEKVSMRLFVNAGAYMETDSEDGIAHYTEHMAFNGSENFSAGTLIKYFQRIGMSFGGDVNAATSPLNTTYSLEVPNNSVSELFQAMLVLADQAGRLLFEESEINRERGVILSELRARNSANFRAYMANAKFIFQPTIISQRFVIGTESTINSFNRQHFKSFYEKWYTADRISLVVVGDIDIAETKRLIAENFSFLKRGNEDFRFNLDKIENIHEYDFSVYADKELSNASISLASLSPKIHAPNTIDELNQQFKFWVISKALSLRFNDMLNEHGNPLQQANFYTYRVYDQVNAAHLNFTCKQDNWREACELLERNFRQINLFGFSEQEITAAKAEIKLLFENATKNYPTELNENVADAIINSISENRTYVSDKQGLAYFEQLSNSITPETCLNEWHNLWKSSKKLFVSGNFDQVPSAEDVKAVYNDSSKTKVSPIIEENDETFAYNDFGPNGNVASSKTIKEIDTQCLRLSNNVRVNIKKTEFSKNEILIWVNIGNGAEFLGKNMPAGLDKLISSAFVSGGLEKHSHSSLTRIFAGKNVSIDLDVAEGAFVFKSSTNETDLLEQLKILCAYITAPGYRQEGLDIFRKKLCSWYEFFKNTPEGVIISQLPKYLSCNDPRFGYPDKEIMLQRNYDDAQQAISPVLKNDYIEITLVGDLNLESTISAVNKTFGALEKRRLFKQNITDGKVVPMPKTNSLKMFYADYESARAIVNVTWPTDDIWDIKKFRHLDILKEILKNRLIFEIRHALGATYSPSVSVNASSVFIGRGSINAQLVVDPNKALFLKDKILEIANAISLENVSDDELNRAINPILTEINESLKANAFWIRNINDIQNYPEKIIWITSLLNDCKTITKSDLKQLSSKYLIKENAISAIVQPKTANKF